MKHTERGDDEAKPKRPRFWLVATVFALSMATSGCRTEGDYLFLEREGAIMPVWVRGNVESGTFVLIVHGGPGSTSQQWVDLPSFQAFEKRYAIAYWDQRGAGTSQGTPPSTSYTVDDAVADTDAVVALLRSRYEVKRFFILAHSWGGFVATAWLLDPAHQVGVDGYVMVSGDFAPVEGVDLARQFVLEYAKAQVDAGAADWQPAVNWAAAPVPTNTDLQTLTRWYQTLGKYINLAERSRTAMAEDAAQARFHATLERDLFLFSPFDTFQALWNLMNGAYVHYGVGGVGDTSGMNLTAQMNAIHVPVLITWGRHDGILPVALAQKAYDALGTDAGSKSVVVFEASAHFPMYEEATLWTETVVAFVEGK